MEQNVGQTIDEIVRKEMVWYRRLWRWLFLPKNTLNIKDIEKAISSGDVVAELKAYEDLKECTG